MGRMRASLDPNIMTVGIQAGIRPEFLNFRQFFGKQRHFMDFLPVYTVFFNLSRPMFVAKVLKKAMPH